MLTVFLFILLRIFFYTYFSLLCNFFQATISPIIPLLILGAIGVFGGCLCLFLPESMGKNMPQTIQDGEQFGMDQTIWDMPCCKG